MKCDERTLCFSCNDSWLYGVLSMPERPAVRGVLILVGGPQYRAGSHRQFTLLARYLASHSVPTMRFDYRGMGDSEGRARNFEEIGDDLRHAIDLFFKETPGLDEVVIWGLCDAASAALLYAHQDRRVTGLILLNPWARTEGGVAKAYLKHYYLNRLFEPALWVKILRGKFDFARAADSFCAMVRHAFPWRRVVAGSASKKTETATSLPERMFDGFNRFAGKVLIILSGNDLTAKEFSDLIAASDKWSKLLGSSRVSRFDMPDANHTFSTRAWRDQVAARSKEWIQSW